MLENKEKTVLNYINSNCQNGKFIVLTCEEILTVFPASLTVDCTAIKTVINNLFKKGFIRLKYDDGSTFCVSSTEQGLNYKEEKVSQNNTAVIKNNAVVGWCVFASFIGGFVGAVVSIFLSVLFGA